MKDIQDPIIDMMERYGGPPEESGIVRCPVCGEECEDYYLDEAGNVIGCESCVRRVDAWSHRDE